MPKYEVGTARFYPELGRWAYPGEEPIELPEDVAERYMKGDAGLLKPARLNTQAKPSVVRDTTKVKVTREAKKKRSRARK